MLQEKKMLFLLPEPHVYTPEECLQLAHRVNAARKELEAVENALVAAWESVKPTGCLGEYKAKGRQNKRNAAHWWARTLVDAENEKNTQEEEA